MSYGVRDLLKFALPLVASSVAMTLDSLVGTFCLSHSSDVALRAALPAAALAGTFTTVATAFLGYAGTVVATHHGFGRERLAVHSFVQGLWLFALTAVLFAGAGPVGRLLLARFGHAQDVLAAETAYLNLLLAAGSLQALAVVLASFFIGRGLTRLPGAALLSGSFVNMVLTPILVLRLGFGIEGAGWSRIIAAAVPCIFLAGAVLRDPLIARPQARAGVMRFMPALAHELLQLAAPNALRLLVDFGGFFLLTALIGALDGLSASVSTAVFAVTGLYCAVLRGVSSGVEIRVAQEISHAESTRRIVLDAFRLMAFVLAAFLAFLFAAGDFCVTRFLSQTPTPDPAAADTAIRTLFLILIPREALETVQQILMAALRGRGETLRLLRIQAVVTCLCWLPLLFALRTFAPSLNAYWLSTLVYMSSSALLLLRAIRSRRTESASAVLARTPIRRVSGPVSAACPFRDRSGSRRRASA